MATGARAASIASWDFTSASTPVTQTASTFSTANLTGAPVLSRGAGAAGSSGANSFRTTGFKNDGISTANTDYFQTTIQAASGYTATLTTINAIFSGTQTFVATAGVSIQWAYSLDGTTFTLIGSPTVLTGTVPITSPAIDLSGISALQNVPATTTVTLRLYASGQTTTGGWGLISPLLRAPALWPCHLWQPEPSRTSAPTVNAWPR